MHSDLPRRIGFWGASAIMVGIIIGSGIFRTPPDIARALGSPALILSLWALGGVLSLFGAFTYAELACMYPQSGGVYVFLREGLGRPVAFVFGWTYMLISKPFAAAGIAVVFGEHTLSLFHIQIADPAHKRLAVNAITTAILVAFTAVNVVGVGPSTGIAKILTSIKLLALAAIVAGAALLAKGSLANLTAEPTSPQPLLTALAPVMFAIMWTYDGWSDVGAIAGEVRNPQRELPRIYFAGTLAVTVLYIAVNAAYMYLLLLAQMRTTDTVAPLVMERLTGGAGAAVLTALVLLSAMGSTHGSILTGARVTFAQARDGLLFRFLGRVHPRYQTPAVSLWFQLALSCFALWYASGFQELADAFVFTMWIFYGLAAAAIFVLRARLPDAPRPFRCPLYPVIPALFVLAAVAMIVLSIRGDLLSEASHGRKTLPWLAVLILGLPVYYVWQRFFPERPKASE